MNAELINMDVHIADLIPLAVECMDRGQCVGIAVTGGSMTPFLLPGQVVYLRKPLSFPRKHDIVLVKRSDGQYMLHRVVIVTGSHLFLAGDAQSNIEGPFSSVDVLGTVETIIYGTHEVRARSLPLIALSHLWVLLLAHRLKFRTPAAFAARAMRFFYRR